MADDDDVVVVLSCHRLFSFASLVSLAAANRDRISTPSSYRRPVGADRIGPGKWKRDVAGRRAK